MNKKTFQHNARQNQKHKTVNNPSAQKPRHEKLDTYMSNTQENILQSQQIIQTYQLQESLSNVASLEHDKLQIVSNHDEILYSEHNQQITNDYQNDNSKYQKNELYSISRTKYNVIKYLESSINNQTLQQQIQNTNYPQRSIISQKYTKKNQTQLNAHYSSYSNIQIQDLSYNITNNQIICQAQMSQKIQKELSSEFQKSYKFNNLEDNKYNNNLLLIKFNKQESFQEESLQSSQESTNNYHTQNQQQTILISTEFSIQNNNYKISNNSNQGIDFDRESIFKIDQNYKIHSHEFNEQINYNSYLVQQLRGESNNQIVLNEAIKSQSQFNNQIYIIHKKSVFDDEVSGAILENQNLVTKGNQSPPVISLNVEFNTDEFETKYQNIQEQTYHNHILDHIEINVNDTEEQNNMEIELIQRNIVRLH